jgi:L-aspartate oxidase
MKRSAGKGMVERFDYLVIGSGIAGLSFALKAAQTGSVAIVTKQGPEETNTKYAQGGIASVFSEEDGFELHMRDTVVAGAGLCHDDVVRMVVEAGPKRVRELIAWGVEFTRTNGETNVEYDLHLEGGHSRKRILHAEDLTGAAIERALLQRVAENPGIRIFEHHMAVDLITHRKLRNPWQEERCFGAYALDIKSGDVKALIARATLLATGGSGKVYLLTSNPDVA